MLETFIWWKGSGCWLRIEHLMTGRHRFMNWLLEFSYIDCALGGQGKLMERLACFRLHMSSCCNTNEITSTTKLQTWVH